MCYIATYPIMGIKDLIDTWTRPRKLYQHIWFPSRHKNLLYIHNNIRQGTSSTCCMGQFRIIRELARRYYIAFIDLYYHTETLLGQTLCKYRQIFSLSTRIVISSIYIHLFVTKGFVCLILMFWNFCSLTLNQINEQLVHNAYKVSFSMVVFLYLRCTVCLRLYISYSINANAFTDTLFTWQKEGLKIRRALVLMWWA